MPMCQAPDCNAEAVWLVQVYAGYEGRSQFLGAIMTCPKHGHDEADKVQPMVEKRRLV